MKTFSPPPWAREAPAYGSERVAAGVHAQRHAFRVLPHDVMFCWFQLFLRHLDAPSLLPEAHLSSVRLTGSIFGQLYRSSRLTRMLGETKTCSLARPAFGTPDSIGLVLHYCHIGISTRTGEAPCKYVVFSRSIIPRLNLVDTCCAALHLH